MSDALTNCPKCGFTQPVDPYCANCGVDMIAVRRKSASSFSMIAKQPAVLAGIAVAAIAIALGTSRIMRRAPTADEARSISLASQNSSRARKENLKATAPAEVRQAIENQMATQPAQISAPMTVDAAAVANPVLPRDAQTAVGSAAHLPHVAATDSTKGLAAPAPAEVQVAFAWTEVSREWLQAMGATDPGLHRVPDLEGRLRDSKGAYRILEVSKQRVTADIKSFAVRRGDPDGDRTGLKVDISSITENGFTGSIQPSFRGPDAGTRAPAVAPLAIEKGQGSILTFPPASPPPGVAPTGAEIVVLILPRWGGDRNP